MNPSTITSLVTRLNFLCVQPVSNATDHEYGLKNGEAVLSSRSSTSVGSGEQDPLRVHLLIGHGVLHVEVQVGESHEKGA